MEEAKNALEALMDEVRKVESELEGVSEKLEGIVQKLCGEGDLHPREEKKMKFELEDLEKEETRVEELYCQKRLQIVRARQSLRALLAQSGKDDIRAKLGLSTLLISQTSLYSSSKSERDPGRRSSEASEDNGVNSMMTQWEVSPKEMEIDRQQKLGSGAFGDVFKGKLRGKEVAIKKLLFQDMDDDLMVQFKKEVSTMAKLRHPNVLLFMGACTSPGSLAMVTELMPQGSVYDQLKNKIGIRTRLLFAKDTALGMNWLHCSNILHLDLKTQNLLVDDNLVVKVADFGLSQIKQQSKAKGKAGSPLYMAPEMLIETGFDEKADVYSFGVVLNELHSQEEPYKGRFKTLEELIEAVTKHGVRPEIHADCPQKLKQLIQSCWNPNPSNRPSFAAILKSNVLDQSIIECVISEVNQIARDMWQTSFLEKNHVLWKDFAVAFFKAIAYPFPRDQQDIQVLCLKEMIVKKEGSQEVVSIEEFGRMLEWFGPLEKGNGILRSIVNVLSMKGFYGVIETADAEKFLNGKKTGSYLIRFSTRDAGFYALTVLSKSGNLKHFRISHKPGQKYQLGPNEFDDLETLVRSHKKDLNLKYPLGGSKYEALFNANQTRLASQGYEAQSQVKAVKK